MALPTAFTSGDVLTAANANLLRSNQFNLTTTTVTASRTLVAADVGTRILMNSASATTITVNNSLFAAGDTLEISNIGAGVCTITSGTCTVTSSARLALNQYTSGTLFFTSASAAIFIASAGGAGQVLQVVSATSVAEVTTTSTAYVTTGLTATITPVATSSKIYIVASTGGRLSGNANLGSYTLFRGTVAGTNLGDASIGFGYIHSGAGELFEHVAISFLDSPSTVSAQVYTMGMNVAAATVSVQAQRGNSRGTITLMEISG